MAHEEFTNEVREEMRFTRAALHDLRDLNRTLVVAVNDNVMVSREIRDTLREMRGESLVVRDSLGEMRDSIRANTESIRANTKAILHVLDELRGRPDDGSTA